MPHVIVKLWPGKSEQQKARLSEAIVRDITGILGSSEDSVSVAIEDVKPEDWAEEVFKPDIERHWDRLYKKPGYGLSDL
jgi:4-oxalocrotonate tautomerase